MYIAIASIVILLIVCAVLAQRLYAVEKNLRGAARQLRERMETHSTVRIGLALPSAAAEDLLAALNEVMEARTCERADYRRQEQAIRQQIANVSHDLRTPLTSILGYLQLLEGETLTAGERKEYLAIVQGRARSLQGLITGFYDLSRLEGNEYPLTQERVDLHAVLSGLIAEFYNDFADKGFDMTVEMPEGLPTIQADSAGVQRVFTNLIRNAVEHGDTRLSIGLYRQGDTLVTTFANDAPHLTGEDMDHIFDRFYTADKMRTGQSTGLGLAIVKTLVERMGHTVRADYENEMFTIKVQWRI